MPKAPGRGRPDTPNWRGRRCPIGATTGPNSGEGDGDVCTNPDDAGKFEPAVHRLGEASGEDQAESRAAFTSGVGAQAIEWHEQPGKQLVGNPWALIGDMDAGAVVACLRGDANGAVRW